MALKSGDWDLRRGNVWYGEVDKRRDTSEYTDDDRRRDGDSRDTPELGDGDRERKESIKFCIEPLEGMRSLSVGDDPRELRVMDARLLRLRRRLRMSSKENGDAARELRLLWLEYVSSNGEVAREDLRDDSSNEEINPENFRGGRPLEIELDEEYEVAGL